MHERDAAYHQGTVWPWLIGPYAEAVLRSERFSASARRAAWQAIEPLIGFLLGPGLGQLHEIHDAEPPHHPRGTMAQAWSVAEVLRVLRLIHHGER
jgi:glycogen debranching enzyme